MKSKKCQPITWISKRGGVIHYYSECYGKFSFLYVVTIEAIIKTNGGPTKN